MRNIKYLGTKISYYHLVLLSELCFKANEGVEGTWTVKWVDTYIFDVLVGKVKEPLRGRTTKKLMV